MLHNSYRNDRRAPWAGMPGLSGLKTFNAIRHHFGAKYAQEGLRRAQAPGSVSTPSQAPGVPTSEAPPRGQDLHGQEAV
jgi:hypothetical protein